MNSAIFFVVCLAFACAVADPSAHAEPAKEPIRERRFLGAYGAFGGAYGFAPSTVSAYSYLAPYPNSGKIIRYAPPVVPAISTYAAAPVVAAPFAAPYAAAPFHALY